MAKPPTQRITLASIAGVLLLASLTGCTAASSAPESAADFGHVHGLAADPSTGQTYAATHNGVWLLPTGALPDTYLPGVYRSDITSPIQVADRAQDTMGFTLASPGLLYASGHPDPAEQPELNPPNLGLIASDDGAETWQTVSLRGETDFHDLDVATQADGTPIIYGYDATTSTIRRSIDNGGSWIPGAQLELRDLATDTSDPQRIYATTAAGLMESRDGGDSFEAVSNAPALLLVTATGQGGLLGVDTSGQIWTAAAVDGIWTGSGRTAGIPEAIAWVPGEPGWLLVADDRGITASNDLGITTVTIVPSSNGAQE
ncbi:F510_1955 family glycosylhydrolase [Plantibacter sp. 2H11-2]|uniref:F510_1955 family glycosylhydrolase n=1 Tax=Plantibacter sp. 2H11-2 TaxID=3414431 RepID=UPI003CF4E019